MSNKTRYLLLGVAALLLVAAGIVSLSLRGEDDLARVAGELNEFGYCFEDTDLYVLGEQRSATIAEVLGDEDLSAPITASLDAGFPSDVGARGHIVALLAHAGENDVITLYLCDGRIELCFMQDTVTGEVSSIAP